MKYVYHRFKGAKDGNEIVDIVLYRLSQLYEQAQQVREKLYSHIGTLDRWKTVVVISYYYTPDV